MKIIVAPLHWGLGHATRMVPLINSLLERDVQVHLASDGDALSVLKKNFPSLPATALPAYNIQYKYDNLLLNSFSLSANILRTIPKEQKAIRILAQAIKADAIISDNRYGCHTPFTKNIFVTHQLNIITNPLTQKLVNRINRHFLRHFQQIWTPDFPHTPNLAGKLAHHSSMDKVQYIGSLSRFQPIRQQPKTIDVLAILSGPEPQRSYFEQLLIQQLTSTKLKAVLVRGKPSAPDNALSTTRIQTIQYASTDELTQLIAASKIIISRSGYSTIMDFYALGLFADAPQKVIFVPTPGQPEQIYLAEKMMLDNRVVAMKQDKFDLASAIQLTDTLQAADFPSARQNLLAQAVNELINLSFGTSV
ncbi:MAG TPA: glycosyltransferase [Saprospiraceae bacterium]|nr:glycosyltransferase [Saprospiraceae bacterium]